MSVAPGRILIVDDNETNRDILLRRLVKKGHTVDQAQDGKQALAMMRAAPYDLVLLDIMMPEMDGYEVLGTAKSEDALRHIPVVMISAVGETDSVARCIDLGAEDYLPKPFNPTILRARVDATLEKKRLRDRERLYAESLQREMTFGRKIQQSFLPDSLPAIEGWSVAARFTPAMEVAGDFYDLFFLTPDTLAVVIGDVCGKGVGAALYMALFRSLIRATSMGRGEPPSTVAEIIERTMTATNEYIANTHREANMFATVFFAAIDVRSGDVQYVNAGHDAPIVVAGNAIRARWDPSAAAVGLVAGLPFTPQTARIEPGELLFVYTDGVVEAKGAAGLFGEARLHDVIAAQFATPDALLDGVSAALQQHTASFEPSDDITLVALRRSE